MRLTTCGGAGFRIGPPETGRRGPTRGPALLGALLTGACAAVCAAGCAPAPPPATLPLPPSASPPGAAPPLRPSVPLPPGAPPPVRVADLVLPFDAYRPTPGQRALMARARAALLARCMHRRGHAVSPPRPDAAAYAAGDPGNSRRYGVADPARARRHGYHLPTSGPPGPGWDAALGRSARRDLHGTPGRTGCDERVTAELDRRTNPGADWQWLALQDARTVEGTARHPAVVAAVARWKTCMERAGHPYPSPEAAIADPRWDLRSAAVTAREKRTATADTGCKWSSGLVPAWFAADTAAQRAVIAAEPARFASLRDDLRARLDRAAEVLER
ncbi:hypothetical protein [Nonomuraea roseoviolacea]|uniref:Lipoprotein n=1 Tax=Nonomuraea roseoviolacea subsp. carminata TaxID=160689 RepID=A0ABT1K1X4_9ACTN|nr:hypothetical protein [Nonomuraea roseoviolacea]MCP2347649.1 hypothetical protein [Nonomuraea roseoviolacea subsp. carminata]